MILTGASVAAVVVLAALEVGDIILVDSPARSGVDLLLLIQVGLHLSL